jgi:hypothetical protein
MKLLATLGTLALLAVSSFAQNAHFVKGPTATIDSKTGDYTVSFKEAGLGNTPVTFSLTAVNASFTFQCFNKGGNNPQGAPNGVSFSNDTTFITLTPRNGQITGSISLMPDKDGADCQGNGLLLFLIAASYQGVTFCDVTNNLCESVPDLQVSNVKIGPF